MAMRPSPLVTSLLLLHFLFCIAQGVRLEKGFLPTKNDENIHVNDAGLFSKNAYASALGKNGRNLAGPRISNGVQGREEDISTGRIFPDYDPSHESPGHHHHN